MCPGGLASVGVADEDRGAFFLESAGRSSIRARRRRQIAITAVATSTDAPPKKYGTAVLSNACQRSAATGGAAAPPRNRTAEYAEEATARG